MPQLMEMKKTFLRRRIVATGVLMALAVIALTALKSARSYAALSAETETAKKLATTIQRNTGGTPVPQGSASAKTLKPNAVSGSKIVFGSSRNGGNHDIFVMDTNGSNQTRLTTNAAYDDQPKWSPDASKILFMSNRDGNFELYTMNADGSSQTRLTNNLAAD